MGFNNNTMTVSSTGDLKYNFIHFVGTKEDTAITPNYAGTDTYVLIGENFRTGYGLVENDGLAFAGDSLTIITDGDYCAIYSYTFSGANNADWKVAGFKNGAKVYGTRRSSTSGNYSGGTTTVYFAGLVAGDDIVFKVANLTAPGTSDPTFSNLKLYFYKLPE
jgi:hypothetical protein